MQDGFDGIGGFSGHMLSKAAVPTPREGGRIRPFAPRCDLKEHYMSVIDDQCRTTLDALDGGVGFAVVDLDSTLLFGVAHNASYFTQEYIDAVAGAAVDMFRGRTMTTVDQLISEARGVPMKRYTREVQTETERTRHFMHIIPEKPDLLLVLITDHSVDAPSGWNHVRGAVQDFLPLLP